MGKLRWYKRDPVAALEGMSNLTLEEVGAYNIVLDLIYARDGAVDDDDRFIAGWLRSDLRVWRRIRARLLECGKLYVAAGSLRNSRADAEVGRGLSMVASASEAGKASARKRSSATSNNNKIEPTTVAASVSTNSTTTTTSREEPSLRDGARDQENVSREAKSKASRLPENWKPSQDAWAYAVAELGSTEISVRELENFTDYWKASSGANSRKRDWDAAWRHWSRRAVDMRGRNSGRGPPARQQQSFQDISDELRKKIHGHVQPGDDQASSDPREGELFPPLRSVN